ncbi:MAG TPA: discoidin domain-containing protein [Ktedonobacteraceae bacterium]|jgi:hypothetical protein
MTVNVRNTTILQRAALPNLALNKPATASSCLNDAYKPANGNDGNLGTYWFPKYRNELTSPDEISWWQVDLQGNPKVVRIELIGRQDDGAGNAWALTRYNFAILGSNDPRMDEYSILGEQRLPLPFNGTYVLDLDEPSTFRYIRATKLVREAWNEVDFAIVDLRVRGYAQ